MVDLALTGEHNRRNATLILKGLEFLGLGNEDRNRDVLSRFPGTDRRFEKLAEDLYTDYGHHPEEIAATLQLAREISKSVVLIYQPHQNWRQHFIRDQYTDQFESASEIHWLPTYLTRENPDQEILSPEELAKNLTNLDAVHFSHLDDELWEAVQNARQNGSLVLFMGAGSIDEWLRSRLGA